MKDTSKEVIAVLLFAAMLMLIMIVGMYVESKAQSPITVNPRKGLNSAFSRDLVDASELIRLENYWFSTIGDITKRPGFLCFNSAVAGLDTFNVTGVFGGQLKTKEFFLAVTGDSTKADSLRMGRLAFFVYGNNDYDSTVMGYLPPDNLYDGVIMKDSLIVASGGAATVVYSDSSGGQYMELVLPGSPVAIPMGDIGSGNISGVFQYAYAYMPNLILSPPSPWVRLQGQNCLVTGITQGSKEGGNYRARRVYRRDVVDDTTKSNWHLLGRVESAITDSLTDSLLSLYIDNTSDANSGDAPTYSHRVLTPIAVTPSDKTRDFDVAPGFPVHLELDACNDGGGPGDCGTIISGDANSWEGIVDTGVYAYGITWSTTNGDTTPITTIQLVHNGFTVEQVCSLTIFPAIPPGVNVSAIQLWRTIADTAEDASLKTSAVNDEFNPSDTTFYLVTTAAPGFSVMEDYVPDSALITKQVYSGGNKHGAIYGGSVPPIKVDTQYIVNPYRVPAAIRVEEHHRQLWINPYTDINSIEFSEVNILDSFPISNKISFPSVDGDTVTAMKSVGDVMVVWQSRSIWLVAGVDRFDVVKVKSHNAVGCIAPNSVAVRGNVALFLSLDGVYEYSPGSTPRPISEKIKDKFEALSLAERELGQAIFTDDGKYILSFDSKTFVYDTKVQGWTEFTFGASSWTHSNLTGSRKLWFGSRTGDSVMIFDSTVTGDQLSDTSHFAAIARLPYIGPYQDAWQILDIAISRGGEGDSIRVIVYDGRNVAVDSMWMRPDSFYQKFSMSPAAFGNELSIEFDDRKKNDSLTIRTIHIWPRRIGGTAIW